MKSPLLALGALAVLAASPALGQAPPGQKTVQVTKVFRYYDTFLEVPQAQRSKVRVEFSLLRDGKPAVNLHPALIDGGKLVPLPLGPTGRFERLPTLDQLHRKLMMTVDAPPDAKLGLNISLESAVPPAEEMDARDVAASIEQVNGVVRAAIGPLSILAPKFTKASFPGAVSGVSVTASGQQRPLPTSKHGDPIFEPSAHKGAVILRFAKAPSRVNLLPAKDNS